jgi:hypothetical protein
VSVATGEGIDALERELASREKTRATTTSGEGEEEEEGGGGGDEEGTNAGDLNEGVTVLAGPSGVGKSSLINRLRAGSALAEALAAAGAMGGADGGADADEDEDTYDDDDDVEEYGAPSTSAPVSTSKITDVDISGGGGNARSGIRVEGLTDASGAAVDLQARSPHTGPHTTALAW